MTLHAPILHASPAVLQGPLQRQGSLKGCAVSLLAVCLTRAIMAHACTQTMVVSGGRRSPSALTRNGNCSSSRSLSRAGTGTQRGAAGMTGRPVHHLRARRGTRYWPASIAPNLRPPAASAHSAVTHHTSKHDPFVLACLARWASRTVGEKPARMPSSVVPKHGVAEFFAAVCNTADIMSDQALLSS